MKRAAFVAVLVALVCVAPARATNYPGQKAAPPIVTALVAQADAFWTARGVVGNCPNGPTVWEAADLDGPDGSAWGRGDGATCELWVSDSLVATLETPYQFDDLARGCQAIAHEDGHARGLGHTPAGLMAGSGPWGQPEKEPPGMPWVPGYCIRFAKVAYIAELRKHPEEPGFKRRDLRHIAAERRAWIAAVSSR